MRVTNNALRMAFLTALARAQDRIAETQTQIATGKRVNLPSDDPFAAARIGEIDASLAKLDQYQANGTFAMTRLGIAEEAFVGVIDNLQRVRELTLQANNATLSNADRAATADELRQRRDSLLSLANATDTNGRFLFSGYSETTQPFVVNAGAVTYNGDSGQRQIQISDQRLVAVNDAGSELFQRIVNGNGTFVLAADAANTGTGTLGRGTVSDPTAWVQDSYDIDFLTPTTFEVRDSGGVLVSSGTYSTGDSISFLGIDVALTGAPAAGDRFTVTPSTTRDIFATLDNLIATLDQPVSDQAGRALMHSQLAQQLVDVDQALDHMIDARAAIGARVRAVEEEAALVEGFSYQLTESLSQLRDLDYAEALSLLSQQLLGLEAAQQTFARTQNLSLFRYL